MKYIIKKMLIGGLFCFSMVFSLTQPVNCAEAVSQSAQPTSLFGYVAQSVLPTVPLNEWGAREAATFFTLPTVISLAGVVAFYRWGLDGYVDSASRYLGKAAMLVSWLGVSVLISSAVNKAIHSFATGLPYK